VLCQASTGIRRVDLGTATSALPPLPAPLPTPAATLNQTPAARLAPSLGVPVVALCERIGLRNVVEARRVLTGVIAHAHLVLADGVVAGAQMARSRQRDTRRGPIGNAR